VGGGTDNGSGRRKSANTVAAILALILPVGVLVWSWAFFRNIVLAVACVGWVCFLLSLISIVSTLKRGNSVDWALMVFAALTGSSALAATIVLVSR
jgi:hypothetical protein